MEEKKTPPIRKLYSPTTLPTPVDEAAVEKIWTPEPWDTNLPSPGFITDFVLSMRGIEAPTKFAVWSAIYGISALLKRDAYLEWYPRELFPNLYIIFVAPPRLCAKTTAVNVCSDAIDRASEILSAYDPVIGYRKELNVVSGKITPEAVYDVLLPTEKNIEGELVKKGSEAAFIIGELTTVLTKAQYQTGMIDNLTSFYDSAKKVTEQTRGHGKKEFRDLYITFFGATTEGLFRY